MKNIILALLLCSSVYGQSWQWGKRGGGNSVMNTSSVQRQEEVYSIVTDSEKNVYILSAVAPSGLDVDGNPKTYYGDESTKRDFVMASFACNGDYRWAKMIGGGGHEIVHSLQIDGNDNIYVAGQFGTCATDTFYPGRIEGDTILTNTFDSCKLLFISKFNTEGEMQWFRQPEATGLPATISYSQTTMMGFATDVAGNSHWLVKVPAGTYAEGAFTATTAGLYIFKYDAEGVFTGAVDLTSSIQVDGKYGSGLNLYRNPYNDHYYLVTDKGGGDVNDSDDQDSAIINGEAVTGSVFIASFDAQGQFLWKRENVYEQSGGLFLYGLEFDEQNNIYIGGKMVGFGWDTFLGLTVPEADIPAFIMKVNPTADELLWSSYSANGASSNLGAIVLNGEEIALTGYCSGTAFTWGDQVFNASDIFNNEGLELLFARFDKETGACLSLGKIPGDPGYTDIGTALAVDASGDYILGGGFGHYLQFDNNVQLVNEGSQSDFFVAKYSTSACSPLEVADFEDKALQVYPNPVRDVLWVKNEEVTTFEVFSLLGLRVASGALEINGTIDFSGLASGCYLVRFDNGGAVKVIKE